MFQAPGTRGSGLFAGQTPLGFLAACISWRTGFFRSLKYSALSKACTAALTRDCLPSDELGRVLEIKNRLRMAEQRAGNIKGVDAALAFIFEDRRAFLRATGIYVVVSLVVLGVSSVNLCVGLSGHVNTLSWRVLAQMLVSQAMPPTLLLCIAASFAIALARGRSQYRRVLRPLLMARPAVTSGAPFSCRACGGSLPAQRSVEARCSYCDTTNLIPEELRTAHADALFREAEALRQRLFGTNIQTISIAKTMRTTLIICVIASGTIAYGIPMILHVILF